MRLVGDLHRLLDSEQEESLVAVKRGDMENPTYAQSQWSAALQLRSELDKRFEELKLNATLECKTTGNRITAAISATAA